MTIEIVQIDYPTAGRDGHEAGETTAVMLSPERGWKSFITWLADFPRRTLEAVVDERDDGAFEYYLGDPTRTYSFVITNATNNTGPTPVDKRVSYGDGRGYTDAITTLAAFEDLISDLAGEDAAVTAAGVDGADYELTVHTGSEGRRVVYAFHDASAVLVQRVDLSLTARDTAQGGEQLEPLAALTEIVHYLSKQGAMFLDAEITHDGAKDTYALQVGAGLGAEIRAYRFTVDLTADDDFPKEIAKLITDADGRHHPFTVSAVSTLEELAIRLHEDSPPLGVLVTADDRKTTFSISIGPDNDGRRVAYTFDELH